jgi:hypothetical protein
VRDPSSCEVSVGMKQVWGIYVHRVKDGIRDGSVFRLVWLENEQETLFVGRNQCTERSDFL